MQASQNKQRYTVKHHNNRFIDIGSPRRIWAIAAIHGEIDKLTQIHDAIYEHIEAGDRLIYLGNYTGYGQHSKEVIDELLAFRRCTLAKQSMIPSDIIYLRGVQEEVWKKLLQLQFTSDPLSTYLWMLGNGLSNTLTSYGLSPHDGVEACHQGTRGIAEWTEKLRKAVEKNAGHRKFTSQFYRAAYTSRNTAFPSTLFVNAGINTNLEIEEQDDSFWWDYEMFDAMQAAYMPFARVIRGYDPFHRGAKIEGIKGTIDAGSGFGGNLICACFDATGTYLDSIEY